VLGDSSGEVPALRAAASGFPLSWLAVHLDTAGWDEYETIVVSGALRDMGLGEPIELPCIEEPEPSPIKVPIARLIAVLQAILTRF
jgi:hypothetical protein